MRATWWGAITGLLLGAVLGGALLLVRGGGLRGPALDEGPAAVETGALPVAADTAVTVSGDSTIGDDRGNALVHATQLVAPAVVSLTVLQQQTVRSPKVEYLQSQGLLPRGEYVRHVQNLGSGVIVTADGLIVTNKHVVEGALQTIVTLSDGRQFQAVVVDEVNRYDLAVLRIEGRDLPVARLAAADDLLIGEWAIAIGSPFGYLLADTQPTVTVGVISAVHRDIKRPENERPYLGMIQTDAAINPGNSGGPLVNARGEVIGINTFIFSGSGGSVGLGFAVPVSRVRNVLDEIAQYGRYRDLDVGFAALPLVPGVLVDYGLELTDLTGVLVVEVREDSSAWKAGLRQMDILREIEGRRVTSVSMITRLVYESSVGDRLDFLAERGNELWRGTLDIRELNLDELR